MALILNKTDCNDLSLKARISVRLSFLFGGEGELLSIEWISIRLDGPVHRIAIKTVYKTLPGSLFGQSNTRPGADISSQISSNFIVVVYCFLCMVRSTCVFDVNVVNCPGF